jgi:hypothetical protein
MYTLNSKSKDYIKQVVGISFEDVLEMEASELDKKIEQKIDKKLTHKPSNLFKTSSRGTPFLFLWRLLGIKEVDKKLSDIAK